MYIVVFLALPFTPFPLEMFIFLPAKVVDLFRGGLRKDEKPRCLPQACVGSPLCHQKFQVPKMEVLYLKGLFGG